MRDDFHSPAWAAHHGQVSAFFHKLLRGIAEVAEYKTEVEYQAPWRRSGAR